MKRKKGIITILVGVGLLFISFFFSSGSHPKRDFIGNISRMEIVLVKGEYVSGTGLLPSVIISKLVKVNYFYIFLNFS